MEWFRRFKILAKKNNVPLLFVMRDQESIVIAEKMKLNFVDVEEFTWENYWINAYVQHVNRHGNEGKMKAVKKALDRILVVT